MMTIVTEVNDWQKIRKTLNTTSLGFVPTMGHLHEGHISLCKRSKLENELTIVSIFVNPTQFNQATDFENYPRTLDDDIEKLSAEKIDYLLLFDSKSLYPDNYEVQVSETEIGKDLEGAYRPGHFTGVLTVVTKLLNLVLPMRAYFGEKDYQQYLLIKKMVSALFMSVEIIACETVRAPDLLALSSRNSRLNASQREKAALFAKGLQSNYSGEELIQQLTSWGFKVDYVAEKWQRRLGAVWLDDIRLIDNIPFGR